MKNSIQLRVISRSAEQTVALGESLGRHLRGGEVIDLVSDLGGGKTTLTRGLAHGAGSSNHVASPTFTMSKTYDSGALRIHHFDFYRLEEAGIMANELAEIIGQDSDIVIIEWSDIVQHVLPDVRLTIRITQTGEDTRQFDLTFPQQYLYMLKEAPYSSGSETVVNI